MKLVLITFHYPFGTGEEFLEPELPILSDMFDSILVLSGAKPTEGLTRKLPKNAQAIRVRKSLGVRRLCHFFFAVFHKTVWDEFFNGVFERGFSSALNVAKQILLVEDMVAYLHESEPNWINDFAENETIFYSYWLSSGAEYIARYHSNKCLKSLSRTHGFDCFFDRGYIPYRRHMLTKIDRIASISQTGKNDLLEHYSNLVPNLDKKLIVSRLGISKMPNATKTIMQNPIRLVSCSSIIPVKRLDLLIDALTCIDDVKIQWIHFGNGPLTEEIKGQANEKLDNKPNIEYQFAGFMEHDDVLAYYANNQVDLFVNCSDSEGIPVSIMEAMAFGIPSISRDVGGNSEIIDNTVGRLLPDKTSPEDLGSAITNLATIDELERIALRRNAQSRVADCYILEKNVKELFKTLLANTH